MNRADRRTGTALFAVALAVTAWGFGPLLVNGISASATTVVFWRMWVAQPVMIAMAYATGGRLSWPLLKRSLITGACFAATIVLGFSSFRETSIVNATLIPALQPALILLVAGRLFGERRTRAELGFAALALAGAAVVVLGASNDGSALYGDLLAVGNLVLFTVYFLLSKHHRDQDVHTWSWIASVFLVAAVCVTPWCLATSNDLGGMVGDDWLWLVLLVLGPGVVGHGLMTWAHAHLDVTLTSLLSLGNPVISTIGAWAIFSQALSVSQVAGAVVVLVGLGAIVSRQRTDRGSRRKRPRRRICSTARWEATRRRYARSMAREMTPDEVRAFLLAGTRTAMLATVRADGRPHVAPVWFVLDGDDVIFNTGENTIKGKTLRRDPRVSIAVDDATPPFSFVMIEGIAELSDDLDEMLPWSTAISRRYMGAALAEQYGRRNAVKGELLVRVRPQRTISRAGMTD